MRLHALVVNYTSSDTRVCVYICVCSVDLGANIQDEQMYGTLLNHVEEPLLDSKPQQTLGWSTLETEFSEVWTLRQLCWIESNLALDQFGSSLTLTVCLAMIRPGARNIISCWPISLLLYILLVQNFSTKRFDGSTPFPRVRFSSASTWDPKECIADFLDQMLSNTIDPKESLGHWKSPLRLSYTPLQPGRLFIITWEMFKQ